MPSQFLAECKKVKRQQQPQHMGGKPTAYEPPTDNLNYQSLENGQQMLQFGGEQYYRQQIHAD